MRLLFLCLSLIIAKGLCSCDSNSTLSEFNGNNCYMGNCIENQCVCFDGWGGDKCHTCMGRIKLNDSSGFITDGPENYSHFSKCSWLIEPVRKSTLRLRFNEFATECGWDHLYIYDGDSAFSPLIGAFNGLLHNNDSDGLPPEIIAKSGTAFLHFYSDQAFRMVGFNISYSVDECLYDCFNRGNCADGTCECNPNFTGRKCDLCNCSERTVQCLNDLNVCNNSEQPEWSVVEFNASNLTPRASFSLSLPDSAGTMWLYGGYNFDVRFPDDLYFLDPDQGSWTSKSSSFTNSSNVPLLRYEHSTVVWNNSLFVFGGKLIENETTVGELWKYDVLSHNWSLVEYEIGFNRSKSNLKLAGHSADLVTFDNGTEVMIVMFGYHPTIGFSPFIYEYDPSSKTWFLPLTNGAIIKGLFAHTTVYDPDEQLIYVHGGMHLSGKNNAYSTDQTLSYNLTSRQFSMLASSRRSRFLHSASFVDGVMYIYGGSVQNSSSSNLPSGTSCYLSDFMAYYAKCDRWSVLPDPPAFVQGSRYGQQSSIVRRSDQKQFHVISGFDSTMISNILVYNIPKCSDFMIEANCNSSHTRGVLCRWNGSCIPSDACPNISSEPICSAFNNLSPLNCDSHSECKHCESETPSRCVPSDANCSSNRIGNDSHFYCFNLNNCQLCESSPNDLCEWNNGRCQVRDGNSSSNPSKCDANTDCESVATCEACNKKDTCLWCRNVEKCVASNSYVMQFPYGQCKEWTKKESCSSYSCSSYDTCAECQNHSRCGWCDDGSSTGLGTCVDGAGSGPVLFDSDLKDFVVSQDQCPGPSWFFVDCPRCQCNGHSVCDENFACENCSDNTTGPQCETCIDGFFGNALNGGNCSRCECANKAVTCDASTGACRCFTNGQIGFSCEECETTRGYVGDATGNGTCYYNLDENYIFTFNVVDSYITAINFRNQPKSEEDVLLSLSISKLCDVRLAVVLNATDRIEEEQTAKVYTNVSSVEFTFRTVKYRFGPDRQNTIIRIYVSKLDVPVTVKVSLIQYNNAILKLLLALFSSLLVVLIIAAVVWKLKMIYDNRQRRAARAVQLKEMAARPFAGISLHCDDIYRSTQSLLSPSSTPYQLLEANQTPVVFCEEKCGSGDASVASVFLWLPSNVPCDKSNGENESTSSRNSDSNCFLSPPPGQASLAIGTVLVSSKDTQNECDSLPSTTSTPKRASPKRDNRASGDASISVTV